MRREGHNSLGSALRKTAQLGRTAIDDALSGLKRSMEWTN